MHKNGINLRYFGLFLYHLLKENRIRILIKMHDKVCNITFILSGDDIKTQVLQIEMVARAYAHILNDLMRGAKSDTVCRNYCTDKFKDILNYNSGTSYAVNHIL
jgi:hypothetical protein